VFAIEGSVWYVVELSLARIPRQALAGLAERMQLGIVWLLGSKKSNWCELLFGYLYG